LRGNESDDSRKKGYNPYDASSDSEESNEIGNSSKNKVGQSVKTFQYNLSESGGYINPEIASSNNAYSYS
jgi:hypothetical protein